MKVEGIGQFFLDGRIVNLDTASKEELDGYLKVLNDVDLKLVDDVNDLLVSLRK